MCGGLRTVGYAGVTGRGTDEVRLVPCGVQEDVVEKRGSRSVEDIFQGRAVRDVRQRPLRLHRSDQLPLGMPKLYPGMFVEVTPMISCRCTWTETDKRRS